MIKVDSPNGKIEFSFSIDIEEGYNRISRAVYTNEVGEHYLVESEEYHIGSAYDYIDTYYALDYSEYAYFEKIAADNERRKKEEALERERIEREDQERMYTSGGDRNFYKKKKSDQIWWLKENGDEHKFSFDKEKIFDLLKDYPDNLTEEQKDIFNKENPFWAKKLREKE